MSFPDIDFNGEDTKAIFSVGRDPLILYEDDWMRKFNERWGNQLYDTCAYHNEDCCVCSGDDDFSDLTKENQKVVKSHDENIDKFLCDSELQKAAEALLTGLIKFVLVLLQALDNGNNSIKDCKSVHTIAVDAMARIPMVCVWLLVYKKKGVAYYDPTECISESEYDCEYDCYCSELEVKADEETRTKLVNLLLLQFYACFNVCSLMVQACDGNEPASEKLKLLYEALPKCNQSTIGHITFQLFPETKECFPAFSKSVKQHADAYLKCMEAEALAKRIAAEAEAKRLEEAERIAAEAQAKRLAAEAEAKRLAELAKRIAEEAEAKRLAEEALRLAAAEQQNIGDVDDFLSSLNL
jgi:hypothetical protein